MPAVGSGRENTTAQPKRKVKRPAKPKVTVAPADRVTERVEARKVQIKRSVSKSPDRQDTKRSPEQQKRDAAVVKKNVADSRRKVIIKRGRGAGTRAVKDYTYEIATGKPRNPTVQQKAAQAAIDNDPRRKAHKAEVAAKVAPVLKVLDQTTRPLHAIAAGTDAALTGKSVPNAALRGIQNKDKTTFSTVLKHAGVKNKKVAAIGGFALDVGLDPTTYLTGGTASVARKTGLKAGEREASKGVTVKFAGKEVPGVRKATSKAGTAGGKTVRKVVPEKVRDAARNTVSEVSPSVAPAGVDKATHQAARKASRKARAATTKGERDAINLGHGIKSQIGTGNYQRVVDAVEAGDTSVLPEGLRGHAETVRKHLAEIRKVQRDAGVEVPERKGYVPRKLTPETVKAENKKAAAVGGRGKTEPGSSKARKEKRTMAEVRETHPGRYREDLHALVAERMAEGTASAARATLAQDLAKLGRPVERGQKPQLTERESVYKVEKGKDLTPVTPTDKKLLRPAKKEGGPKYVVLNRKLVERTMGTTARPEGGTIAHGYDRVQGGFKRIALATPGYHVRNMIGDTAQAYVHQPGQKLAGNMVRAGRVLKAAGRDEKAQRALAPEGKAKDRGGTLKTKQYGHVSYEEAARKLIEAGAARSGYTARELRELSSSGKAKVRLPKSPGGVRRAFLNREDLPRLATAIHAVRQGATWEEAAAKVADVHFDYSDLTPFERNTMRRIMPFYTWTARNVPLQAKRLVTNPGKFATFQKVRENAAQLSQPGEVDPATRDLYKTLEGAGVKLQGGWEKYLTEYEKRNAGIPVSWKGQKFTVSGGFPLTDLNELPGMAGPGEYVNKAMSMVTPIAKDPIEFLNNYSFFFRDQIERDNAPLVAAPSVVGKWPEWARKKVGVVKAQDKRSGKMIWQWPGKADYVAHAVPGLPSAVVRSMTPGHDRQGKGPGAKALGWAGVKATPVDATSNAINLAYARLEDIKKAKGALNQQKVGAKFNNVTPEYQKLLDQEKVLLRVAYQGKVKRKDVVLPTQGGPKKGRGSSAGRVKVPGVSGRVKVPGAGGRVKVP